MEAVEYPVAVEYQVNVRPSACEIAASRAGSDRLPKTVKQKA